VLALSLLANVYLVLNWQPSPGDDVSKGDGERSLTETTVAAARSASESNAEVESAPTAAIEGAKVEPGDAKANAEDSAATAAEGSSLSEGSAATASASEAMATEVAATEVAATKAALPEGARTLHVVVEGPISRGFEKAAPGSGARLAMVASRLLVWNLNLTRDPRKGDTIDLIYSVDPETEVITIHAMNYVSKKFSRNFDAYRYKPSGRRFASYFDAKGREVPARLSDSPIAEYQEITSLIGDGRGHHGMDFKAPVGTPIVAPWDGKILRTNWNWKYNGNSIELRSHDGRRLARFLHLDKLSEGIAANTRVKKGQALASSGNTGRSFAPHLHYEISDGSGRVLDPLDVHDIRHPRLSSSELEDFKVEIGKLSSHLGS
jgi:murein DD-endopeptidase MepM/ murein hydrolase activator NlpD